MYINIMYDEIAWLAEIALLCCRYSTKMHVTLLHLYGVLVQQKSVRVKNSTYYLYLMVLRCEQHWNCLPTPITCASEQLTYCVSWEISSGSSAILLSLMSRCVSACRVHAWGGSEHSALPRKRSTRTANALAACCASADPRDAHPPPQLRSKTLGGCTLCVA